VKLVATKTKRRRKIDECPVGGAPGEKLTIDALRPQITKLVAGAALDMVEKTIEQVKAGQYQALKYLFEMVGMFPAATTEETARDDSLGAVLMSRLGISGELDAVIGTGTKPTVPTADAVE
jgi:hypothetical protein